MRWYQRFFRRTLAEKHLDAELRFHLDQRVADLVSGGMAAEEARRRARIEFGGLDQVKEECRDVGVSQIIESLIHDVRYGVRMLRKNPGFTTVAVLTLALGIGANTAIFSLINAVLLKTLPVSHPEELVLLRWESPHNMTDSLPYPTFAQLRDSSRAFEGMFAFMNVRLATVIDGKQGTAAGELVSGSYFSLLGVPAVAGRAFTPEEDRVPGGNPVAVISYGYWKRQFGLSPSAVGKSITLNRQSFTIIGVSVPGFEGLSVGATEDIWVPMMMQAQLMDGRALLNDPKGWFFRVIARRKPGVSLEQATASANVAYQQIARQEAGGLLSSQAEQALANEKIALLPTSRGLSGLRDHFGQPLLVLMMLVGLVLLVACANVAGLLLARAGVRQKEIAVRATLGAGRARIIRQLLTESILLGLLGGLAGLFLARFGDDFLLTLGLTSGRPLVIPLRQDGTVLIFTASVAFAAAVLFGCVPALQAARFDLNSVLNASTRGVTAAARSHWSRWDFRKLVVAGEVAVSLLLLTGSGMLVRTLSKLRDVYPGFNQEGVLLVRVDPTLAGYNGDMLMHLYNQLPGAIRTVPGVLFVSLSSVPPMSRGQWRTGVFVQGHAPSANEDTTALWNLVEPNFFRTLEIPLLQGRDFTMQDTSTAPKVAIINEAMAHFYFGKDSAIGKRLSFFSPEAGEMEIVGIVADAKYGSLREAAPHMLYLPYLQAPPGSLLVGMTIEIRTDSNSERWVEAVTQAIRTLDKNIPILAYTTLAEEVNGSLAQERTVAELSSFFSLLAVVLAAVGLYGVMTYTVARRTGEIGIRVALGAERAEVLRMVLRESLELVLTGLAVGIPLILAFARLLSSQLYGISAFDPWTILTATAMLVGVSAVASYIPARRATKVDPMVALRYE